MAKKELTCLLPKPMSAIWLIEISLTEFLKISATNYYAIGSFI